MLVLYSKIGYELWIKKRVGDSSALQTIHGKEMSKIARSVCSPLCEMFQFVVLKGTVAKGARTLGNLVIAASVESNLTLEAVCSLTCGRKLDQNR